MGVIQDVGDVPGSGYPLNVLGDGGGVVPSEVCRLHLPENG